MATQKLSIYTMKFLDHFSLNKTISNLISLNDQNKFCLINEQTETYVGGYYMVNKIGNETTYNIESKQFETIPIRRLVTVKFDLNLSAGLLMVWGNKTTAITFVTALGQAAENKATIDTKIIDFKKALNIVLKGNKIILLRMKINNIVIDNGIVVNCSVNLSSLDDAKRTVIKYLDNISQISICLGKKSKYDESPSTTITLYSSGSLVVYSDKDEITDEALEDIYKIVGGKN